MMSETCSWKRCRQLGNYIGVADRKNGTYHLCQSCWERVAKIENGSSIQENLTKVAIPKKFKTGDNDE
tara:strand:+ start:318 stop:521 length:204 start_codon:yes stop_codon:yes gene_type:complete